MIINIVISSSFLFVYKWNQNVIDRSGKKKFRGELMLNLEVFFLIFYFFYFNKLELDEEFLCLRERGY